MNKYMYVPWVAAVILRVTVGVSLLLTGLAQYRDFAPFVANVTDGLGPIALLGNMWAFLLPALLIFGGGLLASQRFTYIAAWVGGIGLGSIPIGLLLKTIMSGLPLPDMIAAIQPMLLWIVVFYLAVNPIGLQAEEPMPVQEESRG